MPYKYLVFCYLKPGDVGCFLAPLYDTLMDLFHLDPNEQQEQLGG